MKPLFTFIAILFLGTNIWAQATEEAYTRAMISALTDMKAATTASDYQSVVNKFERIAQNDKVHWQPLYYTAFLQTVNVYSAQDKASAVAPLEGLTEKMKALLKLESVANDKAAQSEIHTLIAMMYSARMMTNPMVLGAKFAPLNGQHLSTALALNNNNPRVHLLQAQNFYYTPEAFGGDKVKAKEYGEKALELFIQEEDKEITNFMPRWGKDQADGLLKSFN